MTEVTVNRETKHYGKKARAKWRLSARGDGTVAADVVLTVSGADSPVVIEQVDEVPDGVLEEASRVAASAASAFEEAAE